MARLKALVTGGAGFVGSHLVDALVAEENEVLVLDNLAAGRLEYLTQASGSGRCSVKALDIRRSEAAEEAAGFAPDIVFHLAAIDFIPFCVSHPTETVEVNVVAFRRLLDALRYTAVEAIVLASSATVYGYGDSLSEAAAIRPRNIYGVSKWLAEEELRRFGEERKDVRCVRARLFSPYGPRETSPRIVPTIVAAHRKRTPLRVGNMWPKRDFIYVTDVVDALVRLGARAASGPVNVGTGVGTSVLKIIRTVERLTERTLELEEASDRIRQDDGHLVADNRKLLAEVAWQPRFDLEAGLRQLLESERLVA